MIDYKELGKNKSPSSNLPLCQRRRTSPFFNRGLGIFCISSLIKPSLSVWASLFGLRNEDSIKPEMKPTQV
ncbi:hypothetical protein BGP_1204 [Beggiatoa sp. PS]|nr:hypothetical protein BGP_1204 [Beggiatoa sp. PS]